MVATRETQQSAFFVVSGTLPLDARSYVQRNADQDLFCSLLSGEYCFVLHSRQMGKSSLAVRAMRRLSEAGVRTVFLDLTKIGGANVTSEQWYLGLLAECGRALGLRREFLGYWKEHSEFSLVERFFGALREVALESLEGPIVVFVDEVDAIKSLSFIADEFFAAARACYNRRVHDPIFRRLTFCLVGSAMPADLIADTRTSPFNVGRRIELKDFTLEETLTLAEGLNHPNAEALVKRTYYWTGGQPHLTQAVCAEIASREAVRSPRDVDRLVAELYFAPGARERTANLADVSNRLLSSYLETANREEHRAAILDLYGKVLQGRPVPDDETNRLVAILKLSGIARTAKGRLVIRNRIYRRVFDRAWIQESMPEAELRRQHAAFRRGVLRATAVASVILLIMTSLIAVAAHETVRAREATAQAHAVSLRLDRTLDRVKHERDRAEREATRAMKAQDRADAKAREAGANAREAREAARRERGQRDRAEKAARQEKRAKQSAVSHLWGSYLAQAREGRWSGRAGRRFDSLEALAKAARIRSSMELRNEAIACMALPDLRIAKTFPVVAHPLGYLQFAFDSGFERYAYRDAKGNISAAQRITVSCCPCLVPGLCPAGFGSARTAGIWQGICFPKWQACRASRSGTYGDVQLPWSCHTSTSGVLSISVRTAGSWQ